MNTELRCDRRHFLRTAKLIVVKIGSAVLADAEGIDGEVLDSLASQLSAVREAVAGRQLIVVSSGAVAAGRGIASHYHIRPGANDAARQALAALGQGSLMAAWKEAFGRRGLAVAQALLTRDDFRIRERFHNATNAFLELLHWDVVPVVNENDTVALHELQFGDNDCLASLLVNLVEADFFINLTSAPGVLSANPENTPHAPVLECIPDIGRVDLNALCGKKTSLGRGGMHSKLLAARRVAQLGVPTLILPGRQKDVLLHAFGLAGLPQRALGTWICPNDKIIPRRKFWLAYQSPPAGSVEIDLGAVNALLYEGRSLLPGGVSGVVGDFERGALVRIVGDGDSLGVGFVNYSATQLREISGRKRHEIAAILGDARYPDVIHRDNMLLDAAL